MEKVNETHETYKKIQSGKPMLDMNGGMEKNDKERNHEILHEGSVCLVFITSCRLEGQEVCLHPSSLE